jgi:hypothetical protein
MKWEKEKGYRQSQDKAVKIYVLAKEGIPTVPSDTSSTKMLVQEAVRVLREVDNTLMTIPTQIKALIAHAGIDAPPYQSGQFIGTERKYPGEDLPVYERSDMK